MNSHPQFLRSLAKKYRDLNLSLLNEPQYLYENEEAICFLGPGGETDVSSVIYCKDLPFGMAGSVGSWFLPPERHILEGLIVFILATTMIHIFLPGNRYNGTQSAETARLRPPPLFRKLTLVCFLLQFIYKAFGYPNKVLAMLLPCNVLWFIAMILSFAEVSPYFMNNMIQLLMTYVGLPILALLQPDTSDCVLFGEKIFFFFHHSLLIYYPLYYIRSGYEIGGWKEHLKWISLGSAFFAGFYVCFVTPICVVSGLNLNYMLHPSLDLVQGGISGQWFRWLSLRNLILLFSTMRVMLALVGKFFIATNPVK